MHKNLCVRTLLTILLLLLAPTAGMSAVPKSEWNRGMEQLRSVLSRLLPDLFSDQRFNSPRNFKRIESNVKRLAQLAHDMQGVGNESFQMSADQDPSIALIAGLFKEETLLALSHLRAGHRAYARRVLKTIPNFCITCHTRSTGLDLSSVEQQIPKTLNPLERAQFLEATREFDRALDEYEKILSDAAIGQTRPLEWEQAARFAIATAVRVKRAPERALTLVDQVLASPAASASFKNDAEKWKITLQEWKKEKSETAERRDDLFDEAKSMFKDAVKVQEYRADRSADILYLRVSAMLHDFLSRFPNDVKAGEAMLMLGMCYETLQDLQIWSLHDLYYETCVRKYPHTSVGYACYIRYEQSTFFGYTGSGGTLLPPEVEKHLLELRLLAEPIEKQRTLS